MRELSEDYGEAPCDYDRNYPRSPSEKARGWIWALIVSLMIWGIIGWFFLWMTAAHAHEAQPTAAMPFGWKFDPQCCGSSDCYPVESSAVKETPAGYLVPETGEVIPYSSYKIRNSPDGMTYRCSAGGVLTGHTYCLYLGGKGS